MGNASQRPEGGDKASVRETAPVEPEKPREDIRDKYELGKVLGSGSFGQVREAILKELPDKVRAVKIIERDDDAEGGGEWSNSAMFRQE
ncbi:CPK3, partial [Symbiodinium microadriaticum]